MFTRSKTSTKIASGYPPSYTLGKLQTSPKGERLMGLLALSHTPTEHELYQAMLSEAQAVRCRTASFSLRRLMELTGLTSYSTVRRALRGLLMKLSIEDHSADLPNGEKNKGTPFFVFYPEEIFERRLGSGLDPFPKEAEGFEKGSSNAYAIKRIIQHPNLSRREAQVALLCMRGLTNAEIGLRLCVAEQTVKFHLRHIFIKFGVRRRAELISRLLMRYGP
jgi:DNA-binding CsgD family transcriptional regulator